MISCCCLLCVVSCFSDVQLPNYIYGIQLAESAPKIFIFYDEALKQEANVFAKSLFHDESYFHLSASLPPEDLNRNCSFCYSPDCKSVTGQFHDIVCKEWIGCGSPVLAIHAPMYERMLSNENNHQPTPENITEIKLLLKQHLQENERSSKYLAEWSLGCPIICENKCAFITAAHPLKDLAPEFPVKYFSQICVQNRNRLVELGTKTWQVYNKRRGLDILILQLHEEFDTTLLTKKVHSSCDRRYINFSPVFDREPEIGKEVTKRGLITGNTFGSVITNNGIIMPIKSDNGATENKAVNAFAVSTIETNSRVVSKFAKRGDSGSVVLDNDRSSSTRMAYGLVWRRQKVYSEIHRKYVKTAIVCAKTTNCLAYVEKHFKIEAFPRHTSEFCDCDIEYIQRS